MKNYEQKALDYFGEIVINKILIHKAGFGSRAIPTYVGEWIISHFVQDKNRLTNEIRNKIANFMEQYVPEKGMKESISNRLYEQNEVKILDNFSVYVNLQKGDRYLNIPFLDENNAFVSPKIVENNEMLLSSGLWGVGTLYYIPRSETSPKGQIWMREFTPFQLANVDIGYFCETRREFTTKEWLNLICSSMGFNPEIYDEKQKLLLICRLLPMVEPRYNLAEPAPKGTGKSFVFDNMSRYVAVRSGKITPAVMFFNDARKTPGLIARYDSVVIDESQKVKTDTSGELEALLKSYLESGKFGRGTAESITAEAGVVLLANIDIDENRKPVNDQIGIYHNFPNFLSESAFLDRLSGLLPGWLLPRITKNTPSVDIGLKGDIFGEILHKLRSDISYRDYVKTKMELPNCDDMRDTKAIESGASGLLKIIYPDKKPTDEEFYKYCVNPAVELRQRVKDELCKIDKEYRPSTIKSKHPDNFQLNHELPKYYDVDDIDQFQKKTFDEDKINKKKAIISGKLDFNRSPQIDTINIEHNDTGYSYRNLFYPYLKNSKEIKLIDPYIRLDYQIKNLIAFCELLVDRKVKDRHLHLITYYDNNEMRDEQIAKLNLIRINLSDKNLFFTYNFDEKIHDRYIEIDNNWKIKLGRGLDFFQKPENYWDVGEFDQTKRKCKETEIEFIIQT